MISLTGSFFHFYADLMISRAVLSFIPALIVIQLFAYSAFAEGFAVVNMKTVMEASPEWQAARKKLETELKKEQTQLELKQSQLKERKQKLDAQKSLTDPKAFSVKQQELLADAQKLTQEFMQIQQRLAVSEKRATEEMLQRIESLVGELAGEGEVEFIFETGTLEDPNVLYHDPKIDMTQKVIGLYKKHFSGKSLKSLSADAGRG